MIPHKSRRLAHWLCAISASSLLLQACRNNFDTDQLALQAPLSAQSSFRISYRLYQTRPGYGNFEDLRPTSRFRQFVRSKADPDRDYVFEIQAPATASDPRVVLTLAKTSFQSPHYREIVFRFFVPKSQLLKTPKSGCHFGYTRQTHNCDAFSEFRSSSEYPFLPVQYENPPLQCKFKLESETLDFNKLFHRISWENPISIVLPSSSTSADENPTLQFHFECQDRYNQVLASDGFFKSKNLSVKLKNQSESPPGD